MEKASEVLREVLREMPGSIRVLAREAGVSATLLGLIRDGRRRLTPEVRDAVAAVLRRWGERCTTLAERLEAAELDERGGAE